MVSRTPLHKKIAGTLGGLGLLILVGFADYSTGYKITLLVFYLLPIVYVLRYAGQAFAFMMAVLASLVWLAADVAAGERYTDYLTPVWNTSICLAVFLLVIVLFSTRDQLQGLVDERTESLRQEIRERTRLEKELLEIAESEQRRIGHDLHDSLGQHLTATAMAGKILAKRIANKVPVDAATADHVVALVEEAIVLTRNLARTLHPVKLESDGLAEALQNLAVNLSLAFNVSCRFQHSGTILLSDPAAGIHLYRIAQEAASNAIRHGRARNLVLSLDASRESLMLTVTDDGTGLSAKTRNQNGMGLRIMDYRAKLIGAVFDIQNLPGGGARAVCILNSPHQRDEL
jgi:signal transduction histidine kinase